MAATLGNNIIVLADGKAICGTKANSIQSDAEIIPIASSADGQWEHNLAGRKSWQVTVSFIMVPATTGNMSIDIGNLLSVGSSYTLRIKPRNGTAAQSLQGSAILKSMSIDSAVGNLAKGSWTFVGNGPLAVPSS